MNPSTLASIASGFISLLLGIIIAGLRSDIRDLKKQMGYLMTKEVCETHHIGHDKEHERIEKDINGLGQKAEAINQRVAALEKAQ